MTRCAEIICAHHGAPRPSASLVGSGVVPAERPLDEGIKVDDQRVETAGFRMKRLTSREGEELRCQAPAVLGRAANRRRELARPLVVASFALEEVGITDDDVSRLLKSCARPPVNWPTASIVCA
jgi:hypothetical protein